MVLLELLIILLLVLTNGALAMSEFAIISARPARLQQMARAGVPGARMALRLLRDPSRFLSTVQIGITLVGIFAGAFSGATLGVKLGHWLDTYPFIAPRGGMFGIGFMVIVVTYLSLVIGELIPKRMALAYPERIASLVSRPMYLLSRIAAPAVWILRLSTDAVLRPLGLMRSRASGVTEEEVTSLIAEATQAGVFVPQERDMIEGVLRIADRSVREIMTPRQRVLWLDQSADRDALLHASSDNPSARLLVCDGCIDKPLGVIHTKDLLPIAIRGAEIWLDQLLTPVLFADDGTPVMQLLERFKREKIHVAVVTRQDGVDPDSGVRTDGLVTLTDILESIAGELPLQVEPTEVFAFQRQDGSWLIDGKLPIAEFENLLRAGNLKRKPGIETVAGLIFDHLQRVPREGESFVFHEARIEIVDMDGQRIDKIIVSAARGTAELAVP